MTGDTRQRYVWFKRDSWGIARRVGHFDLTPGEVGPQNGMLRQIQAGWIVTEQEAKDQR